MNKQKIKEFIKKNKVVVGISGAVITIGLLSGVGYGIHKLNSNNNTVTSGIVARSGNDETQSNTTSSSDESKNSDTSNNSVDGNKQSVNNRTDENKTTNEKNKQENSTTSSENNKKDDVKNSENKTTTSNGNEKAKLTITTDSSKGSSSSSNNNTSKGTNQTTNSTPSHNNNNSHSHSWTPIKKTVHHKEQGHYENVLVKPAWTEKVPVYEEKAVTICNTCGKDITGKTAEHAKKHMLNGENGSYRTEWRNIQVGTKTVKHEAVYKKKWVVDKKAYDETITTGYKCSCGATK